MGQIFGTFILSTSDEQYKGEFFNNKMKSFSNADVAIIETSAHDGFVGSFDITWEESTGPVTAVLEIDMENNDVYILNWKDVKQNGDLQNTTFTGRAVKRNGILVSIYSMITSGL